MHRESDCSRPIIKDGLFKPRGSPKFWRNPVAGFGHGAGDPGVARFVGTDQADGAEVCEQRDENYQRGGNECRDVRIALRFCRFAQSAMSLTFSLAILVREARGACAWRNEESLPTITTGNGDGQWR